MSVSQILSVAVHLFHQDRFSSGISIVLCVCAATVIDTGSDLKN